MQPVSRFDVKSVRDSRSVTLAELHGLTYTAKLIAQGQRRDIYTVPSRDRRSVHFVVRVHSSNEYVCDCTASEHDLPCGHCGAALWLDAFRFVQPLPTPARAA